MYPATRRGDGIDVVPDVAAVILFALPDAGVVVYGDDADRNIVLDLAHDAAVAQRVNRDVRGIIAPLSIGQTAPLDNVLEGPVVVRVLPCAAAPFAADRLYQQRRTRSRSRG
jgi:hypothetical protein